MSIPDRESWEVIVAFHLVLRWLHWGFQVPVAPSFLLNHLIGLPYRSRDKTKVYSYGWVICEAVDWLKSWGRYHTMISIATGQPIKIEQLSENNESVVRYAQVDMVFWHTLQVSSHLVGCSPIRSNRTWSGVWAGGHPTAGWVGQGTAASEFKGGG